MIGSEQIDALTVQIAHLAGTLEAKGEIEDMEWHDLRETVAAIINQYDAEAEAYWNDKNRKSPDADEIAERMLKERYQLSYSN